MPLEDPFIIDIITTPAPGKVELIIADAGVTMHPERRLAKLARKLKAYVTYIASEEFRSAFPDAVTERISILVVCNVPPTPAMARMAATITPAVRFEIFDPAVVGRETFMTRAMTKPLPRWRRVLRTLTMGRYFGYSH